MSKALKYVLKIVNKAFQETNSFEECFVSLELMLYDAR